MVEKEEKGMFNYELKGEWLPGIREKYEKMINLVNSEGFEDLSAENIYKIREIIKPLDMGWSAPVNHILGKYYEKCTEREFFIEGSEYG